MIKKLLVMASLLPSFMVSALDNVEYQLGAGDEIQILVYDEPDLTVKTTINDDGNVHFPLIGVVSVAGNTTRELQKLIHDGLEGEYLLNPSVQIDVVSYRPFYIHGEVKKPGAYSYQPGLNIDQAVALAGGLTERASVSKIFIKQSNSSNQTDSNVELSYSVSPGDTVTIKQSFF